jgi:prepilin-type N-terminal cleavage/methylation domain-containing protein
MRRYGYSLIEVVVAMGILTLLLAIAFNAFVTGANAWQKGDAQTELLQNCQLTTTRLSHEAERTIYGSVTVAANGQAVSMASAVYASTGQFAVDPASSNLQWQNYLIFYYDASLYAVCEQTVPISPPTFTPVPIEQYNAGNGPQPLSSYLNNGTPIAHDVTQFNVHQAQTLLTVNVTAQKGRYGSQAPETVSTYAVAHMRN